MKYYYINEINFPEGRIIELLMPRLDGLIELFHSNGTKTFRDLPLGFYHWNLKLPLQKLKHSYTWEEVKHLIPPELFL